MPPFLVTSIPDDRRGTPCGCPYGVASFPGRAVAPPPGPVGTESLDSGNAVGAADGPSPPSFWSDHAGGPAVGDFLVTSIPDDRRGTPCGCPYGVASFPGRAVAPPPGPVGTESLDSGNAVGAADGQCPPSFWSDHAGDPAVGDFLVTSIPDDRRGTPCGCPPGSHRSPAEPSRHPPAQ